MRRTSLLDCLLIAIGFLLAASQPAAAQINTAQLGGQVTDPQGLAVANAKVSVRNLATGATRSGTADASGHYEFVGLPPGHYELTVEGAAGFAKLVNPDLLLTIGQAGQFDPHLQLQAAATSVTVNAAPDLIETGEPKPPTPSIRPASTIFRSMGAITSTSRLRFPIHIVTARRRLARRPPAG